MILSIHDKKIKIIAYFFKYKLLLEPLYTIYVIWSNKIIRSELSNECTIFLKLDV